ncbi:gliding motility-associated C-terminal domain-containing protein [Chitinophaga horti]|uniref:Gliding motility-associated C-terminal domain-containing protein n=1 Tax=Chitinophaga horti TaxID=2920382 RepID=A0ABY6IVT0_9BACT|nr:Calx-beta domain-containing protein [Chitinophaga horti]UYQ91474.1 gliding motility-associated C-terminal domain-containing protein [Chitinophaga horti]
MKQILLTRERRFRPLWLIISGLMLLAGHAFAQAPAVTINPTGGNNSTDGLQIIVTDTGYLVKKNGKWETNMDPSDPAYDRGLRTYVVIEPRFDATLPFQPQYLKSCQISAVSGTGTTTDPWKVITTAFATDQDGAKYQIESVITYAKDNSYFLLDYLVAGQEGAHGAFVHIYLSEHTSIAGTDCGKGFVADYFMSGDAYLEATSRPQLVGVYKDPGDCGNPETGAHIFRVAGGFTSWYAAQDDLRDEKTGAGFLLKNVTNAALTPVESKGIVAHKAIKFSGLLGPGRDEIMTKRFLVGFENETYSGVNLADPVLSAYQDRNYPLTLNFSDATGIGDEGQDDHILQGLKLHVSGGTARLPIVVRINAAPTGVTPATPGSDYEVLGSLVIPAGDYSVVPVDLDISNILIKGNGTIQPNRTFTLSISTDCVNFVQVGTTHPTAVYTIEDDDAADIKLIPAKTTLAEGESTTVTVKMNGPVQATDVIVTISKGGGNAEASDFTPSTFPFNVTIPAGSSEVTFPFTALNDLVLEPVKDSVQLIASATLSGMPKNFSVYIGIVDETGNTPANKVLTLSAADALEGANAAINFRLPAGVTSEEPLSARFLVTHGDTEAADFDIVLTDSITVNIPANTNSVTYNLGLTDDDIIETLEAYSFDGVMTGFSVVGGTSHIIDGDYYAGMPITLSVDKTSLNEDETLTFTASLPGTLVAGTDILVAVSRGATSTATAADYGYLDSYIIISAGHHSASGTVVFEDDDMYEPTEQLVLEGAATGFTVSSVSASVLDLQSALPANRNFNLSTWTTTYNEGEKMEVHINLQPSSRVTEKDMTVTLSVNPASTLDPSEYVLPASIVIPAGQSSTMFEIDFLTDLVVDGDKTLDFDVTVDYFGHPEKKSLVATVIDTTTIYTPPTGANILVSVNPANPVTLLEGASWTITFTLDGYTNPTPTVINLNNTSTGHVATAADFTGGIPTTVTIPANSSSASITFQTIDDHIIEHIEQLRLSFAATGHVFSVPSAELNIDGNDRTPGQQLGLDVDNSYLYEGGAVTYTVSLPSDYVAAYDIPVTLAKTAASTAGSGDATGMPASITIPAGSHSIDFVVTTHADDSLEMDEFFEVEASATNFTENYNSFSIGDVTIQTEANVQLAIVPESGNVEKGESVKVWVNLPAGVYTGTNYNYTVSLYTNASSTQFSLPSSITIPPGANGASFDFTTVDDGVADGDEVVEIYIMEILPVGYFVMSSGYVTMQDPVAIPEIHVNVPAASVTEGNNLKVTFSLPSGYTAPSAITINLAKQTVTSPATDADFTAPIPSSITIPAGGTMVELDLTARADMLIEVLESLRLTPTATGYTFDLTDIDVDVIDADYTGSTMPITLNVTPASVNEGTSATIRASLPAGLTASYDIDVNVTKDAGSTAATGDHGALPTTLHITAGSNASANATITTATDNILESAETVVAAGTATGFTVSNGTLTINDATSANPLNTKLTLTPVSATITEGASTSVSVSLPTGITAASDISVTLSSGVGSSTGLGSSDYNMPVTVTIPAGSNSASFTVSALTDAVIEGTEVLQVMAQSTVYGNVESASTDITITDATTAPVIDVDVSSASINEGSATTITFELPSGVTSSSAIVINLVKNAVTPAAVDADFTAAIPTSVTIPANTSAASFTLTARADQLIEVLEKLQLGISATGYTFSQSTIDIDVVDGDYPTNNTVTLSVTPGTVTEGNGSTLRASLPGTITASYDITVNITKGGTSTADLADHGTLPTSILIPAGSNSATAALTTATDNILEASETWVIEGTATGFTVQAATLTIDDATGTDPLNKHISITPATVSIAEGANTTLTVALPTGITSSTDITVNLSRGAASSASLTSSEYSLPASVMIAAGANSAAFTVTANTDSEIESTETLIIDAAATVWGSSETASATVSITDATATPVIDVNVSAATIDEGDQTTITFSLPTGVTSASPIVINLAQGTATPAVTNADFTSALPTSVTIAANASSASITLEAREDQLIEVTERLQLLATATGYTFSQSTINIDVTDGDYPTNNTVTLSVTPGTVTEGNGSTLRASLPGTITASYDITVNITKGGTSTADLADHGTLPTSILIPAGSNSATAALTTATDNILEASETWVIEGTATGFTVQAATLTIDDATGTDPLNKHISITPTTVSIAEGANTTLTVALPTGITSSTDITVNLSRGAASSASLTSSEYSLPASVTIAAGTNSAAFTVSANTDSEIESTENLIIDAAATVWGSSETASATVSITDATATPVIDVNVNAATINEGGQTTITFSLPVGVTSASPIVINLAQGTATPAVTNADFTAALPTSVTIAANASSASITLEAREDQLIEVTERLQLLATATGYTFSQSTINIDVADGDYPTNNTVTLSVTPGTVTEGNGSTLRASLPGTITASYDITVNITKGGTSTADLADHGALPTSILIPAGSNSATAALTTATDNILEASETWVIEGSATGFTVQAATLTIDDATGTNPLNKHISITPATVSIAEGANTTLTVALPTGITSSTDITVNLSRGAASSASLTSSEYSLPASVMIAAGANSAAFTVTANTDSEIESTETLIIDAAATVWGSSETASATVSITDATATPVIDVNVSAATINEGGQATITFSLPTGVTSASPIVINLAKGVVTPASGDADFNAAIPADVTIAANGTSTILTLQARLDQVLELTEHLQLTFTATGYTFSQSSANFDIIDGDHLTHNMITLSVTPASVAEGAAAAVQAALPAGYTTAYDLDVTIGKAFASTAGAADHSALPGTIRIAAGDHASNSVTINTTTDNLLESAETVVVEGLLSGFTVTPATLTITDVTSTLPANTQLTFAPDAAAIREGENTTVRVSLPTGVLADNDITINLARGAASSASLHTTEYNFPASLTIPAGVNSTSFVLTAAADDHVLEVTEVLEMSLAANVYGHAQSLSATVSIEDATSLIAANMQVTLSIDSASLSEGNASKVTAQLPTGITAAYPIIITLTADASSTASATDYGVLPATLQINAGDHEASFDLTATADLEEEDDETLTIRGTAAGFTINTASVVIPGDDVPAYTIDITKLSDAAEPATNGSFRVSLSGTAVARKDVQVTYVIGGTATSGVDYDVASATTVTIPAGQSAVTIPVTVKDDQLIEVTETIVLTLQSATTIMNNNPVPVMVNSTPVSMSLTDDEAANTADRRVIINKLDDAAEPGTAGRFEVKFVNSTISAAADVKVDYTVSGTATAGTDYTALSGSVIIPAGSNSAIINVYPLNDTDQESGETIVVTLANISSALSGLIWEAGTPNSASMTLGDDDLLTVELSVTETSVNEGDPIRFTLKASSVVPADLPVTISADHDAIRNYHITANTMVVTIPAGSSSIDFTVQMNDNDINDANGHLALELRPYVTGPTPYYELGTAITTRTEVLDNDAITIIFKQDSVKVSEGNSGTTPLHFTVELNRRSSRDIVVDYAFTDAFEGEGVVQDKRRATAGSDFDASATSITIPAMTFGRDIIVNVNGDETPEANEFFTIRLIKATSGSSEGEPSIGPWNKAIGVILNDDAFCLTCDTDGDGLTDGEEDINKNLDPTDDDTDNDGIPNYLDLDSDNDGVPDSVERFIRDGRITDNNRGDIRVHPALSPNGDGRGNEVMMIENILKYQKHEVVVMNRFGGVVYRSNKYNNANNSFKGRSNTGSGAGNELPDGSYFYVVIVWDSNGKEHRTTGFVVLKR